MEKSSKRGKIPQSDWPLIMARYEAGETLASIARTYDCSPPAISYIVSRNRGKPTNEAPPPAAEPQLIKAPANGATAADSIVSPPVTETRAEPQRELEFAAKASREPENGNLLHRNGAAERQAGALPAAAPRPTTPANEPRPKLHLGFGNGNGNGNGAATHAPAAAEPRPQQPYPQPGQRPMPPRDAGERSSQPPFQSAPRAANPFGNGPNGRDFSGMQEPRPAQLPRTDADTSRKDNAALGQELRTRVDGDIAAFLAAFDAVLAADTQESRFGLREATDRLLRAGARTRIELERLEARVPLAPRDGGGGRAEPAWRYR
jgi:transposase-like protein